MTVFLSHITEEAPLAAVLKDWIESTFSGKTSVFVSSSVTDLPAGTRWLDQISEALENASVFLVLCSPRSIQRPWVNFETGCGWIKGVPVIPICHSGQVKNGLPTPLSLFQALQVDDPKFVEDLFRALSDHLGFSKLPRIDRAAMIAEIQNSILQIQPISESTETVSLPIKVDLATTFARMTQAERAVFAQFVKNDSKVASFYLGDDPNSTTLTAVSLARRGYLCQIARQRNIFFETITFELSEAVFAFFQEHPELLADVQ